MTNLHLDTDLGGDIDDLCAIAMLLKWENLEISGITTVAEDNGKRAGYTKDTFQLEDRSDIAVAADISGSYYRSTKGYLMNKSTGQIFVTITNNKQVCRMSYILRLERSKTGLFCEYVEINCWKS